MCPRVEAKASKPWCGIIFFGGPWGTVPELLFEKKGLIPALQRILVLYPRAAA
jgi:hypothetical protein